MANEVEQVVGGGVQQEAKGVGQEAMAAQAVGAKTFCIKRWMLRKGMLGPRNPVFIYL